MRLMDFDKRRRHLFYRHVDLTPQDIVHVMRQVQNAFPASAEPFSDDDADSKNGAIDFVANGMPTGFWISFFENIIYFEFPKHTHYF